jgi:hypothetical protein
MLLSTDTYIYFSSYRIKSFYLWMHSLYPGSPYEGRHLLEFSITTHVTLYKHAIPAACEETTYRQYSFVSGHGYDWDSRCIETDYSLANTMKIKELRLKNV